MIEAHDIELRSLSKLSFIIGRHDIVGFCNTDSEKEQDLTELLKGNIKLKRGWIDLPKLVSVEISESIFDKISDDITVYKYLNYACNEQANRDNLIDGMLELAELSQYKESLVKTLSVKERYRLAITMTLLKKTDLIILHNLFENAWDDLMNDLLCEASLQSAIVVFSKGERNTLQGLPIHSYDLKR